MEDDPSDSSVAGRSGSAIGGSRSTSAVQPLRRPPRIVAVYPGERRLRDLLDRRGLSPPPGLPPRGPCFRHGPLTDGMEITPWMDWFLGCLGRAIDGAESILGAVLVKARFWENVRRGPLNKRQTVVLRRMSRRRPLVRQMAG